MIVTMDDATSEHYAMFLMEEEGTASSFAGVKEVIESRGLFSSLYTDRGSHYWSTPEAGGKADRLGCALRRFSSAFRLTGQFICFDCGHLYLLTTVFSAKVKQLDINGF